MTTSEIVGQNYRVTPTSITLFGCFGGHSGTNWVLTLPYGGGMLPFETAPTPLSSCVSAVLAADTSASRDHLIKYVVVSPQIAVSLFLEGLLTFGDFLVADETSDAVLLENVQIDERAWTVVVAAAPDYDVMTVDANGHMV